MKPRNVRPHAGPVVDPDDAPPRKIQFGLISGPPGINRHRRPYGDQFKLDADAETATEGRTFPQRPDPKGETP